MTVKATDTITIETYPDYDAAIEDAAKVATNYIEGTTDGLIVGNMTADTLDRNVLIDADSVDIRDGSNVLASFGETTTIGQANKAHIEQTFNKMSMFDTDGNMIFAVGDLRDATGVADVTDTIIAKGDGGITFYLSNTPVSIISVKVDNVETEYSYELSGMGPRVFITPAPAKGAVVVIRYTTSVPYGYYSIGMRKEESAIGSLSVAEGYNTTASGIYSHAEGKATNAKAEASHSEGAWTYATGTYSHAEGSNTIASGHASHAEGTGSIASGTYSHAEGSNTIASSYCQHAGGRANVEDADDKYIFILGNGSIESESTENRSNAFAVDWDGYADAQAGYKVNGTNIFDLIYPVGSIYMSVNNTNPGTLFGGTWVAWGAGRVPVGVGSGSDGTTILNTTTAELTGGEYKHTLSTSEIPAHTHGSKSLTGKFWNYTGQSSGNPGSANGICSMTKTDSAAPVGYNSTASGANDTLYINATHEHTSVGGSGSHNNIQPYITCYMWKRTA